MKSLVANKGDALELQRKVHELEFLVAEIKFKLTESECERDVRPLFAQCRVTRRQAMRAELAKLQSLQAEKDKKKGWFK